MLKALPPILPMVFLVVSAALEALGDAVVRKAILEPHQMAVRVALMAAGGALLLGYGTALNLAPVEFSRVAGLYLATLFAVWQVVNFVVFRGLPTTPILAGGALIIAGGLIVTFWRTT
jgi:hypothetical protein